jgi:hypothetical protein
MSSQKMTMTFGGRVAAVEQGAEPKRRQKITKMAEEMERMREE